MSSFKEKLSRSGTAVLDSRAKNLYELTKIEGDEFVRNCKARVLRIQGEIDSHNDVAVRSTDSLMPGGENFDPKEWINKRHELERKLRVAKIEYALALKVHEEEFPDSEEDTISLKDIHID